MNNILIQLIGEDNQKCRVWIVASKIASIETHNVIGTHISLDNGSEFYSYEQPEQFLLRLQALSLS